MDLGKVLAHLHSELENLDAAIASLQRLQEGGRRRGRPRQLAPKPVRTEMRRPGKSKLESFSAGGPPPRGA